ncbi:hypothetical protein ACFLQ5_03510, partial [Bacteroidota bacterium]
MKTRTNYSSQRNFSFFPLLLSFIFIMLIGLQVKGQSSGDYRSASTGNWTALATWQRYNGTTWSTPTTYPGQNTGTKAVTIQAGHIVTIDAGGITTQAFSSIIIQSTGRLYLTGANSTVTFSLNTSVLNIASGGDMYFYKKSKVVLTTDAAVSLVIAQNGLVAENCNNNAELWIESQKYAVCAGAPGDIFLFSELIASGGTLDAIPNSNTPICEGSTINLTGNYAGAIGSAVTYSWSVTDPGSGVTVYPTQNPSITSAVTGTYSATLTVTTILSGTTYTNSETISVVVNALPTLTGATQAITVCDGTPATINLTGLVASNTFTLNYSINGTPQTAKTGLIASAGGTSSFTTTNLSTSNNGQTLRITGITITNPTTNCAQSFTQDVTLSVWTTGDGTWIGTTSTDWNTASNWCSGIPTASTNVVIPAPSASVPNQPTIGVAGGICNNITINSGATLTISGSNALNIKGNWTNNGTFTCNSSTVSFTGSTAQSITGTTTFNNLTISNTSGVVAANDIAVNGVLNLSVANPSTTLGLLSTGSNTLLMGSSATTTGSGDVTGYVQRTSFSAYSNHTFGNQFTAVTFISGGTYPTSLKVKISIGTAPSWKPAAIKRVYDFVQTGGFNCYATIRTHYLDAELNGNTEQELTQWTYGINGQQPAGAYEWGRSNSNTTDNWVEIVNVNIGYFPTVSGNLENTLSASELTGYTWNGSVSTDWTNVTNWTPNGSPSTTSNIVIPDAATTSNDPVLITTEIKTMTMESGAILNGGTGTTLTINGDQGAWLNQGGTFNPGTSKVKFTNTTSSVTMAGNSDFYDIETISGVNLDYSNGAYIKIAGTVTNNGSATANGGGTNIVEYNGGSQTVVVPSPSDPRYFTLILSGTGTKTMPAVAMSIYGDFTVSGSASVTLTHPLTIYGNLTLGSGTSLTPGSLTHNLSGDFINNGATFTNTGSTINLNGTSAQTIGGTSSTTFNNLTINNSAGVTLGINQTVNGTLDMTSGLITTGSYTLTEGCNGSITNASSSSYINGKLARIYCTTASKTFPIGKGGNYRPLTLEYTALTGTSTVTAEQFESTIAGSLPANHVVQTGRYCTLSESGGSSFTYTLSLNGSSYNPGSATPKILNGDGSANTAYTASFSSPDFTETGLISTISGNYAVGSECTAPSIDTQPSDASSCDESGTPSFSVAASGGTLSYQWEESTGGAYSPISNGGVYSNAATSALTITNPPIGMNAYTYHVVVTRLCGSSTTSNNVALTVNAIPTITLGANPTVCSGTATVDLTYSATTASPDQYRIDYDADAEAAGFTDVSLTSLPTSPISLSVPLTAGAYNGIMYVKNSTTVCESAGNAFTVTITVLPQGSLSGSSICSGETGQLTFTASSGTNPFTVVYKEVGGSNQPPESVSSGIPFDVFQTQTTTKTYTLVSVTGLCPRTTGFTQGSADVSIETAILWTGTNGTNWFDAGNWCGGIPTTSTDVIIPNTSNQPVIGAAGAVCRNITINRDASLTINSDGLGVYGNWTNNGTFTSNVGTNGTFTGSSAQIIDVGNYTYFDNLIINNSNGITSNSSFSVKNTLTLTSGKLDMSGNILTIGTPSANGSISGGSSSSYIVAYDNAGTLGVVRYRINSKNDATYTFPIGDNDDYSPFTFKLNNSTSAIEGAYLDVYVSDNKIPGLNSSITNYISRYWDFSPGGTITSPNFDITMVYTEGDIVGGGNESAFYPIKYSNSDNSWYTCSENTAIDNGKIGSGSVNTDDNILSWTGVTSFSSGSGAGGSGPLPVSLFSFNGKCNENNQSVDLSWSCASETNNDFFTIERSYDLSSWEVIDN